MALSNPAAKVPRVSVVMSVFNGSAFIREAVDSILRQSYENFEFIVVDDASTDESLAIMESYNDPRIFLLRNDHNIGLTRSLNRALEASRGEFIARLDCDDVSFESRLELQVDYLDEHKDVGLLGTQDIRVDQEGVELKHREKPTGHNEIRQLFLIGMNPYRHSSAIFRRECIDRVGPYRTEFRFAQDYDLWLRISEVYQVANLSERLCLCRVRPSSMTYAGSDQQAAHADRAHILALQREIYGVDELGYGPPSDPYVRIRHDLGAGFVARRRRLSERHLWLAQNFPYRRGERGRWYAARYLASSLFSNPLNINAWKFTIGKMTDQATRLSK